MAITTFTSPMEGALFYAARGMLVFPTDRESKKPLITGWQEQATTDAMKIREFFARFPGANFGVRLRDDEVVIDLDRKNEIDGVSEMQALCIKLGIALKSTFTINTPTGGQHLYFKTDKKLSLSVGKLGPGIDIRTEGGYVIGAGSSNSLGSYRIEEDSGPVLLPIPEQFSHILLAQTKKHLSRPDDSEVVGSIPEGRRDNELTRWAGALRGQGLVIEEMEAALLALNQTRCAVPLPDADVLRIAHSIGKKPRGVAQAISDFATDTVPAAGVLPTVSAAAVFGRDIPPPNQCLANFCDVRDVLGLFGKSKAKKSWAMMQMAFSFATGTPFLGLEVPKPRLVLLAQLEVHRDHFERRMQMLAKKMDPEASNRARKNLHILHGRGLPISVAALTATAKSLGCEALFIDPIYPLFPAGENSVEDVRPVIKEIENLAESGLFIAYSHHDSKGISGDRALVDRGSGSGLLGRAYDSMMALDPHSEDPDAVVFQFAVRSYDRIPSFTARWAEGEFTLAPDLDPTPKTSFSEHRKRNAGPPLTEVAERILDAVPTNGINRKDLWAKTGIGRDKLDSVIRFLADQNRLEVCQKGQNHQFLIKKRSLPVDIQEATSFSSIGSIQGLV